MEELLQLLLKYQYGTSKTGNHYDESCCQAEVKMDSSEKYLHYHNLRSPYYISENYIYCLPVYKEQANFILKKL